MSLATESDVTDRLGRELTEAESGRVESLLEDASAVVIGYCGSDFEPEPYPSAVVGVVAKMVARVFERGSTGDQYLDEQSAGPFSQRFSAASSSGDVWLTAADKLALKRDRRGGGLTSVQFVGERYNITESTDESSSSSSSSSS